MTDLPLPIPDLARARRNRNNKARGNAIEREMVRRLGVRHLGPLNHAYDGGDRADAFVVQVKSFAAGRFPSWITRILDALRPSLTATQTPLVVIAESRQGVKRRALVVLDLEDWIALHGPVEVTE